MSEQDKDLLAETVGFTEKPSKDLNDGGAAFPSSMAAGPAGDLFTSGDYEDTAGMSLRDWYAGKALQGLLASTQANIEMAGDEIAGWSYDIADAMLKARKS